MRIALVLVPLVAACGSAAPAAVLQDGAVAYGGMRLSAPIMPDATFMSFMDPDAYGKLSEDDRRELVQKHTFSFPQLLVTCSATDPTIVSDPKTQAEKNANYAAVARCAYAMAGGSPGWVPQLFADVDICLAKIGGHESHEPGTQEIVNLPTGYAPHLAMALAATGATEPMFARLQFYSIAVNGIVEQTVADKDPITLANLATERTTFDPFPNAVRCIEYDQF